MQKIIFLCFLFTFSFLNAQSNNKNNSSNSEELTKKESTIVDSKIKKALDKKIPLYTNGNIISTIDFNILKEHYSIIIPIFNRKKTNVDLSDTNNLISKNNSNDTLTTEPPENNNNSNEKTNFNDTQNDDLDESTPPSLSKVKVDTDIELTGPVVLEQADLLDTIFIDADEEEGESVLHISGRTRAKLENKYVVEANSILFNTEINIITYRGDVILYTGEDILFCDYGVFDVSQEEGFFYRVRGAIRDASQSEINITNKEPLRRAYNRYDDTVLLYRAQHATVSSNQVFYINKFRGTYSRENPPTFNIFASSVYSYENQNRIIFNFKYGIYNYPAIYFPFIIEEHFGTGLDLKASGTQIGRSVNEGFYFRSRFQIDFHKDFSPIQFNFNFYEKVGTYFRSVHSMSFDRHNYNFSFALSQFLERGRYPTSDLFFTTFQENTLVQDTSIRYKILYDHSFELASKDANEKGIRATFKYNIKKTGIDSFKPNENDPFFTYDLENRSFDPFDYRDFFQDDINGSIRNVIGSTESDEYSFSFDQRTPSSSLKFDGQFNYDIVDFQEPPGDNKERYSQYLQSIVFPDLTFSYNGKIDPFKVDSERKFFANINYSFTLANKLQSHFTNETNRELRPKQEFQRYENDLSTSASFNRSFTTTVGNNLNQPLTWADLSYNPSLTLMYKGKFGGEDLPGDLNTRAKNAEATALDIFFKNAFSLKLDKWGKDSTKLTAFDISYNNSVDLQRRWQGTDLPGNWGDLDRADSFLSINHNQSFTINFPSKYIQGEWTKQEGYLPMVPKLSFTIFYNISKSDESTEGINRPDDNQEVFYFFRNHDFGFNSSLSQDGYRLFWISGLNTTQKVDIDFKYLLIPSTNESGHYQDFQFRPVRLGEDHSPSLDGPKLTSFKLNYDLKVALNPPRLNYEVFKFVYSFPYEILFTDKENSSRKVIDPQIIQHSMSWTVNYKNDKTNPWFSITSFQSSFSWLLHTQRIQYSQDNMSFNMNAEINFFKYFKLSLAFSSSNPNAFLYRRAAGDQRVNFFRDIFSALGLVGNNSSQRRLNQQLANFKFNRFSFSLSHDLGAWQLSFNYSITPLSIPDADSLRGFFFDQRVSLNISLKPKYNPDIVELTRDTFKAIERDANTRSLDGLINN